MSIAKKLKIQVKKDHLSKVASGSPETALSEIIWNSLDADATNVNLVFCEDAFGVSEIIVSDDGGGIPYEQAEALFISLGGSWKASKQRTVEGRFLHGESGEGRFKAFALGRVVEWHVVYKSDTGLRKYAIEGRSDSLDELTLTDEEASDDGRTGVEVRILELNKQFRVLDTDKAIDRLTPIFALYLSNYPSVRLSVNGKNINPAEVIRQKHPVILEPIYDEGKLFPVELEIVEWNGLKERELWFCNANGFPLEHYAKQIRGIGDFGFSGYLKSDYFNIPHSQGLLLLGEWNPKIEAACDDAVKEIKKYFLKRSLESAREELDQWKEEKIYPYTTEPETPVEIAERQVFDIVAINIRQSLPDFENIDRKTKAFQFRMIRQAIEKSPEELQYIIQEVLQLPKGKQEQLAELLKDFSLSNIISAASMVSDRLKFLAGLEHIVFDEDITEHLKERSQLHRILAQNTWIFGHAFSLSVDDKSLTEVLRQHAKACRIVAAIDSPVKRLDGSTGIIDLMLSRSIPRNHSKELEHLIVELKAPKVPIGEKEIQQIKSYAFAVAKDDRFIGLNTRWHFWVISKSLEEYAEMELSQDKSEEGIIYRSVKPLDITIWIKTWSQLIRENKYRLEFIREKLNCNIDKESSLDYLRKTYAELTSGLLNIKTPEEQEVVETEAS